MVILKKSKLVNSELKFFNTKGHHRDDKALSALKDIPDITVPLVQLAALLNAHHEASSTARHEFEIHQYTSL